MRKLITLVAAMVTLLALTGAAQAQPQGVSNFRADLSGAEEVPPVETDTTGTAKFKVRGDVTIEFKLDIKDADGILGEAGAHIHCGAAGTNGPVAAFLAGVVPGGLDGRVKISGTLTADNILDTACSESIEELVKSMQDGDTYVNVHSIDFPAGEVRGQIRPLGRG